MAINNEQEEKKMGPANGPIRVEPSAGTLSTPTPGQAPGLRTSNNADFKIGGKSGRPVNAPAGQPTKIETDPVKTLKIKKREKEAPAKTESVWTPPSPKIAEPAPQMPLAFKVILGFSYLFLVAGLAVGLVALLDMPVPEFMSPVVDWIGGFFIKAA